LAPRSSGRRRTAGAERGRLAGGTVRAGVLLALFGILMGLAGPLQLRPHRKKPKEIIRLNLE